MARLRLWPGERPGRMPRLWRRSPGRWARPAYLLAAALAGRVAQNNMIVPSLDHLARPSQPPLPREQPGQPVARLGVRDYGFITDLEGSIETFERYLQEGSVLRRDEKGRLQFATEDTGFVFGGDLFDRGEGDLRLARELVDLKRRHPDRVLLLMGNRDINKMRFTAELSEEALARGPEHAFRAWWDEKAPTLAQYLQNHRLKDTRTNRLKWMLKHSLGSPNAFEFRRRELAVLERARSVNDISDEDVVESFLTSVQPGGAVTEYLEHAQLAAVVGDTLFVHGAIAEGAIGFVPSIFTRYKPHTEEEMRKLPDAQSNLPLREWVDSLNEFAAKAVADWQRTPSWRPDGTRGGEALMAYQSRPATAGMTVVVTCYVDGKNMPGSTAVLQEMKEGTPKCANPASPGVVRYLARGGVRRVVVGHKPSGDAPASLRLPGKHGFEVISADTNYATGETPCFRGGSWCEVRISLTRNARFSSQARLRGHLCNGGGSYDFPLQPLGTSGGVPRVPQTGDALVGRQTPNGWWVRLRLRTSEGLEYILSRGAGRKAEYRRATAAEVKVMDIPLVALEEWPNASL